MAGKTRISVTLSPGLVAAADRRAEAFDRSRSWVVEQALQRHLDSLTAYPEEAGKVLVVSEVDVPVRPGLGEYRRGQIEADLALTPEERVREAEETARASELRERGDVDRVLTFERFEDYLDWKRYAETSPR